MSCTRLPCKTKLAPNGFRVAYENVILAFRGEQFWQRQQLHCLATWVVPENLTRQAPRLKSSKPKLTAHPETLADLPELYSNVLNPLRVDRRNIFEFL